MDANGCACGSCLNCHLTNQSLEQIRGQPDSMDAYTKKFFNNIGSLSRRSANKVVPVLLELVHPKSVVDVGCGTGEWLAVFSQFGLSDFLGIDGSYVDPKQLAIPQDAFVACNLPEFPSISRKFDLVLCLEVAEHLPPSAAETFVKQLTSLGPVILFSAAVPAQGGNQHLNEQWPDYWACLFEQQNYLAADVLRERFWDDPQVAWYYAQNMLLYVSRNHLDDYPRLQGSIISAGKVRRLVHPALHLIHSSGIPPRVSAVLRALPGLLWRSFCYHSRLLFSRCGNAFERGRRNFSDD